MSIIKTNILLINLIFVSCIQTGAPHQEPLGGSNGPEQSSRTKTFAEKEPGQNINLIFSSQHKPLSSLDYINMRVLSDNVKSVRVIGSSKKNITSLGESDKFVKHLVHPKDQYIVVEVTREDGTVEKYNHSPDIDEIII